MFENFPKIRPALPPEFEAIYSDHYKENREGGSTASGLAQRLESWMHRKVAADSRLDKRTLEIGAGTLNHLPYEPRVLCYEIVEPFRYLIERSPLLDRISGVYSDIDEIAPENEFDRIISIATFEHICDLPTVVAKCGKLLAHRGCLRVAIPSEGTILWRLGYKLTTGLEFRRKYGLDYEVLMQHEHVNSAAEIKKVLRYFFADVRQNVFGLMPSLSIYQFFRCSGPIAERCEAHA
jgi:hypothetical protein